MLAIPKRGTTGIINGNRRLSIRKKYLVARIAIFDEVIQWYIPGCSRVVAAKPVVVFVLPSSQKPNGIRPLRPSVGLVDQAP